MEGSSYSVTCYDSERWPSVVFYARNIEEAQNIVSVQIEKFPFLEIHRNVDDELIERIATYECCGISVKVFEHLISPEDVRV